MNIVRAGVRKILPILFLSSVSFAIHCGYAQSTLQRSTAADAKAMLKKAAGFYKEAGRERALAGFNSGGPPFRDRDLYVLCIRSDHTISANGALPKWVGMSVDILSDTSGTPLGDAMLRSVAGGGSTTVSYEMFNPVNGKLESKVLFTAIFGADVCGVGVYSPR